ncbi:MAG: carboxypeptidase-like regulatory domain-containing protein [Phycisphaerae bacterium]
MEKITSSNTNVIGYIIMLFFLLFYCGCTQSDNIVERNPEQGRLVTQTGGCDLSVISTEPPSPAILNAGEKVYVTFEYDMGDYNSVQIWARPRTNGSETTGYLAHPSPVYHKYDGAEDEIYGYFFFDNPAVVDEIVIRMKDKAGDDYVCVAKKDVHFEWKGSTYIKASLLNDTWDERLFDTAQKIKRELHNSEEHENDGALVYRVHSPDGLLDRTRTKLYGEDSGYRPGDISEGQIEIQYKPDGEHNELRIINSKYHEFRRSVIFEKGVVVVWDDIVLEPVTPETACTIKGTISLEDDADPCGIKVSSEDVSTITDKYGNFSLTGVRSGEVGVYASKDGYNRMYAEVDTIKSQISECKIDGYRTRKAKVRWAYQPDGSRVFDNNNVVIGTAELQYGQLDNISFAAGFVQAQREADFRVYQSKNKLLINTPYCGRGPAITETNIAYNDLKEAPDKFVDRCGSYPLEKGKVFVFKCYDGQHYAKMEVLEIID